MKTKITLLLMHCKRIFSKVLFLFITVILPFFAGVLSSPVSAAPAVAPVTAEFIAELLVALGIITGSAATGYYWVDDTTPYVQSIFEEQIGAIDSSIPISSETLGKLSDTVIPTNVYKTDGTSFYLADTMQKVSASDLFLTAKSLAGTSYNMPTNVTGIQDFVGAWSSYGICKTGLADIGKDIYYVPYLITDTGYFIFDTSLCFNSPSTSILYNYTSGSYASSSGFTIYENLFYPRRNNGEQWCTNTTTNDTGHLTDCGKLKGNFHKIIGTGSFDGSTIQTGSCLTTQGIPVFDLIGNKEKLEGAIVQVEPDKDDDGEDGKTPPVPQPPTSWQIWQTIGELDDFLNSGEITNGGTSYGQYVNNNYNYVDVDINVPDTIHNDVTLSGGLDINGQGDINITVHEDISLPSAGDGSGFFNPDAADVVGALGKDNPVTNVVSGLFSALDPALVGIFSISVSLLFVLGLWKLIRG